FLVIGGHAGPFILPGSSDFSRKRARWKLHRARFQPFLVQAVTQGALSCPVPSIFGSSGHARSSIVPGSIHFWFKRSRKELYRARLHPFFVQAVTQEAQSCPVSSIFVPSGHARSSIVPASIHFWFKRSRKELYRARFHPFLVQAVTQGAPSCPASSIFLSSGHAGSQNMPASISFSLKWSRKNLQCAQLLQFLYQELTQEAPT